MAQMFAYYQDVLNIKYLLITKKAITKGYKVQATTIESQNAFDPMPRVLWVA